MRFCLINDTKYNSERTFVKKLILLVLLFRAGSDCLAVDQKESVAIASGAIAAVGLWSWWGHVSNKNAIFRAESLWSDCHAFIGKQEQYRGNDLQKSLYLLESNPILKRQKDIVCVYKSLSGKMNWFWNRSDRMKAVYEESKFLKKSLEAYLAVFNEVKQRFAAQRVGELWEKFSLSDLMYDPSGDVVKSTTLQALSEGQLLLKGLAINDLYLDFCYASSYCYEFADAHKKIVIMKEAHDRWLRVCNEIRSYDNLVAKYQDFICLMYKPHNNQDFIIKARENSSGEFPLLNFVKTINQALDEFSRISLRFSYIRLENGGVIVLDNALIVIKQHLEMVVCNVIESDFYRDELRFYREKLRLQEEQRLLAEEQRRLGKSIDKVKLDVALLKLENLFLEEELKHKRNW